MADEYDNMSMEERAEFDKQAKQKEEEEQASSLGINAHRILHELITVVNPVSSSLQVEPRLDLCLGHGTPACRYESQEPKRRDQEDQAQGEVSFTMLLDLSVTGVTKVTHIEASNTRFK
jgi:hypothetical protein